jgi:hypothetical protein
MRTPTSTSSPCGPSASQIPHSAPTGTQHAVNFFAMQDNIGRVGLSCPWFIGKSTFVEGAVSTDIQNAQVGLISVPNQRYAGANLDAYTSATYRRNDLTHLTNAGNTAVAGAWADAFQAVYG